MSCLTGCKIDYLQQNCKDELFCVSWQAIEHYTKAVELDTTLASAYSNRAMAHLKLGQVTKAETDCNHTLLLQPDNVKALLRRATARYSIPTSRDC